MVREHVKEEPALNATTSGTPLTISGRQRLLDEQARLRRRLQETTERLREELSDRDDLNSYLTQEELGQIHIRLTELQSALQAEPATGLVEDGMVGPGSRVIVLDESGREHSFRIVAPIETDAAKGHISFDSPVGAALLGRGSGDSVSVRIPAGERRLTVVDVENSLFGGDQLRERRQITTMKDCP
jgi:transcription elongation factor GreA